MHVMTIQQDANLVKNVVYVVEINEGNLLPFDPLDILVSNVVKESPGQEYN